MVSKYHAPYRYYFVVDDVLFIYLARTIRDKKLKRTTLVVYPKPISLFTLSILSRKSYFSLPATLITSNNTRKAQERLNNSVFLGIMLFLTYYHSEIVSAFLYILFK